MNGDCTEKVCIRIEFQIGNDSEILIHILKVQVRIVHLLDEFQYSDVAMQCAQYNACVLK